MHIHPCSIIREAEQATFAQGKITSSTLMSAVVERLWQAVQKEPELCALNPQRVVVYSGKGNNAGDALGLAARFSCPITLRSVCEPEDFSPESREQYALLAGHELSCSAPLPQEGLLIIDGLLGNGASGPLREPYATLVHELNTLRASSPRSRTLAIDVPTGLNADTGERLGEAVVADVTATIGCAKPGLLADGAEDYTGRLLGIALPEVALPENSSDYISTAEVLNWLPGRNYSCFKNRAGRVHIIAGSVGYTGAAQLCAEAAVAAGAGLVALYCKEDIYPILAARVAAKVMVTPVRSYSEVPTENAQAVVIGPGLGRLRGAEVRTLHDLLHRCRVPLVMDADGLNLAAEYGWELPANSILTPHPGEMRRLFPASSALSRATCVEQFLQRTPCTLLLKGARSIISDGRETWYNTTGGPYMANGGQGDVLAGVIGAFAAQGLTPLRAAVLAAYACGQAAATAHMKADYPTAIRASEVIGHLRQVHA